LSLAGPGAPFWRQIGAQGQLPPAKWGHAAIWDPIGRRMLVSGGKGGSSSRLDVWIFSLNDTTWTHFTPAYSPPCDRLWHVAVYDSTRHRMLIHGGKDAPDFRSTSGDTWALSLDTMIWPYLPTAHPLYAYGHSAIYDPIRDRLVAFGSFPPTFREVYETPVADSANWTRVPTLGTSPGATFFGRAVYDPLRDRMVLFSGQDSALSNDTWALELGASSSWVLL